MSAQPTLTRYRFLCPRCDKITMAELWRGTAHTQILNCGNCLFEDVEIVRMGYWPIGQEAPPWSKHAKPQ